MTPCDLEKIRPTRKLMESLGFELLDSYEAVQSGFCPDASPGGDSVFLHRTTGIWFQGVPITGEQLFRAIYSSGKKAGHAERLELIKRTLSSL